MRVHRRLIPCLFAAVAAIASAQEGNRARFPEGAEAREVRLLAQLSPSVRSWVAQEGRREPTPVTAASAVRGRFTGLPQGDVESLVFLVMMESARDADNDLGAAMTQMQATNKQKATPRQTLAARGARAPSPAIRSAMRDSRAYSQAEWQEAQPVQMASPAGASPQAVLAPAALEPPSAGTLPMDRTRHGQNGETDSPNDLGELEQLQLQQATDRRNKAFEALSNLMKRVSDTDSTVIQNLK